MEKRTGKVNISSAGGTASKGSKTCKITLPNSWLETLGIDGERREMELLFDGNQIILSRRFDNEEFVKEKLKLGHEVRLIRFYDAEKLCTVIWSDFTDKTLIAENYVNDPVKTAFGNTRRPAWEDLLLFFEERCIPRQRAGLREYLDVIGVCEYDPLEIVQKTSGRMAEDNQWLKMEILT